MNQNTRDAAIKYVIVETCNSLEVLQILDMTACMRTAVKQIIHDFALSRAPNQAILAKNTNNNKEHKHT